MKMYTCPMHPEVQQDKPGTCPKCGMKLVKTKMKMDHASMKHGNHVMKPTSEMSFWERLKMSMTMSMGMEHGGLAGRDLEAIAQYMLDRDYNRNVGYAGDRGLSQLWEIPDSLCEAETSQDC